MKTSYYDDIRQSLFNTLDHKLLEQGAYVNIVTGQTNARGGDLSLLYPVVDDELYSTSGHIWQSAFPNWVYESGISNSPNPIVASGAYVNGTFTPKSNNVHVDYINGRVIFDTAIATSSTVRANFSFHEYSFVRPEDNRPYIDQTKYKNNSMVSPTPFAATPDVIYLPAILIELGESNEVGFQFGGTHEVLPKFRLIIVSDNLQQLESIVSTIMNEGTRAFPIVAANLGPKLNFFNDTTENYSFAQWCALSSNFAYVKSVNYNRFYDVKSQNNEPSLFGGIINFEISAIR